MADWEGEWFEASASRAAARLGRYFDRARSGEDPVVRLKPAADVARELRAGELIRGGGLDLDAFLEAYLANSTRLHHPGYLAHQVAAPHPIGAVGGMVHGLINNPMAIYEMGPSAVVVELAVIEWMLERAGLAGGAGVLVHGGSLANLCVLLAARAAIAPEAWEEGAPRDLAILAPPSSHYSIARAVSILGLGSRVIVPLPVDGRERIMPDELPRVLRDMRGRGLRVMALVADACATSTGFYDPLAETAAFCREHGVWFHVDGAHGASALVSERERHRMRGVELADSLIWDAHKMLRTPSVATAVLFRDERAFDQAFHQEASYLFYGDSSMGPDLIHRTVECTKAELGLQVFLQLAVEGEAGVARYVEGRVDAARRFAAIIGERPGFSVPFEPESNIVCFRRGEGNERQVAIREALRRDGRYLLSSAEVAGVRYLRLSVMAPATDEETIRGMLSAIERVDG